MTSGGVHDFALLRWLFGEVACSYALRAPRRLVETEGRDTSVALFRFRSSVIGTLAGSCGLKGLTTARGSGGPILSTLRATSQPLCVRRSDDPSVRRAPGFHPGGVLARHDVLALPADPFGPQIAQFLGCIRTGQGPITSGCSRCNPLASVVAAYRAMGSGQPIERNA